MDSMRSWTAEDEAIIATNTEATECKRCAVELGYWKDEYIGFFAKRAERKPPEINRGYYTRVKGMEMFINQFLERCGTKCQIINLGCGFDTLYWRLKDSSQAVANFIEIDLPTVVSKKCQIIKRNKKLLEKLANEDGEVAVSWGAGPPALHAEDYHLVAADLHCASEVRRALHAGKAAPDRPALILAECVLVYLRGDAADDLLRLLAGTFPSLVLLLYEQCSLSDRFGEVMSASLSARGVGAPADRHRAPPEKQAEALLPLGFSRARAWPLTELWTALPASDRARLTSIDPLDELELLHQLHAHYALTIASKGDLFADIDLNAT